MEILRVLVAGDTVGESGRKACREIIPRLREKKEIDFVVVNGENLAGGAGITASTAEELFRAGVDVITSGDHYFDKKEAFEYLRHEPRILRPANYPKGALGFGTCLMKTKKGRKVGVINLLGRVFLRTVDCPFQRADEEIKQIRNETSIILVDIHAEATSEKVALGWYLDGRTSAVFGTHTHVQTADETILPQGTAYITELGMTGPYHSVLGRKIDQVIQRFITQVYQRLEVSQEDPRLSGAIIDIDAETGRAVSISRLHERLS